MPRKRREGDRPTRTPAPRRAKAPPSAPEGDALQQMSLFVAGARAVPDADPSDPVDPVRLARPTLWQVHDRYLLAETRTGLVVVDQHAAHQRVLFDEALAAFDEPAAEAQRLLFPLVLRLPDAEHDTAEAVAGLLAAIGYEVEATPERTLVVHSVPNPHPEFDAERCLRAVIAALAARAPELEAMRTQHQRIALAYAAQAAIRPGQRLSQPEMGELFDRLFATSDPMRAPLGERTLVQLPLEQVERWFAS